MFGFLKSKQDEGEMVRRQFARDLAELTDMISRNISLAQRWEEVESDFEIMRSLASLGILHMRHFLGIALLDRAKEWYDYEEGIKHLQIAAEKGYRDAQYDLALLYYHGTPEVSPDPVTGHYWMRKASENGFSMAVEFLRDR